MALEDVPKVYSKKTVEEHLNSVDYEFVGFAPSDEALKFVNFIKAVNGGSEENQTPPVHLVMMDNVFNKKRRCAIMCFRGVGKALELDTPILTPTGYVPMGNIKVGMEVINRNGKAVKVQYKSEVFKKPSYRVSLEDGSQFVACEDHFNIVQSRQADGTWEEEELTTKELVSNGDTQYYIPIVSKAVEFKNFAPDINDTASIATAVYCRVYDIPDAVLYGSVAVRTSFLNDFIRLAGNVQDTGEVRFEGFGNKDKELVDSIIHVAKSLGMYASKSYNDFTYSVTIKPGKDKVKITSIELVADRVVESQCISVNCPTKSFLIEGCVPTRNTTIFAEYLILYIAAFGYFPGFGKTNLMLYVTDSIENGVKNLRRNVEYRYQESEFLQSIIPNQKIQVGSEGAGFVDLDKYEEQAAGGRHFTDIRLEFMNTKGHRLVVKGYGSLTGVRGAKEMGQRPQVAILDDLLTDEGARSASVIETIYNTVYKAVSKALHPNRQKMIFIGTPFNANDPLYQAVESGAWDVSVFPICESFPVPREEFKGAWEDRFGYDYVEQEYNEAMALRRPENFNQELMLRIMSDEDRLVSDDEFTWYSRNNILKNKSAYNFYITTDFATSTKKGADYSVISVWAYSNNGDWLLVDGMCKRQLMDKNIEILFQYVSMYRPLSVGIEVTGQQGGFISWVQKEMVDKNVFFNLAGKNGQGIRPVADKLTRFNQVLPLIKQKKIWLPEEMRGSEYMTELLDEIVNVSRKGFKSKHDDVADTISMLVELDAYKPSEPSPEKFYADDSSGIWTGFEDDDDDVDTDSTIF